MRRLIPLAALFPVALALCACGGKPVDPNARAPAPDVASNFSQPLDARGFDPGWGLTIRGTELTLTRDAQPAIVATAPGASIQAHAASWTGALPNGQVMKVSVFASPCADAASGASYPLSAEIQMPDAAPLDGCAGPPAGTKPVAKTAAPAAPAKR